MPPLRLTRASFTWDSLFDRGTLPLSRDWNDDPLPNPFAFVFAATSENIYFGAEGHWPQNNKPQTGKGEFAAGLWEYDVVELFLADLDSDAYQEFNLAPNGAWWSTAFESYRKPAPDFIAPKDIEIFTSSSPAKFRAAIRVPLEQLAIRFAVAPSARANLCAILGENPRRFLSWHTAAVEKPDFHLSECFRPLEVLADG